MGGEFLSLHVCKCSFCIKCLTYLFVTIPLLPNGLHPHILIACVYVFNAKLTATCWPCASVRYCAAFKNLRRFLYIQLNMDKTEFMWCPTTHRQHRLPVDEVLVCTHKVTPSSSVHDLKIFVDSDLVMRTNALRTVSRCFAMLSQLRGIRQSVLRSTLNTHRQSGAEPSSDLQSRMQSVLNFSARLISGCCTSSM